MKTLAIIPCAGLGTRLKMKKHEAKEMLPDERFGFDHIIDYSLNLCKKFNLEPLVISRKEKKELNIYLKKQKVRTLIIEPKGEWPETVLASKDLWKEDNILILPDTRFTPITIIDDIKQGLELGNNSVMALHKVSDPKNWGIIDNYWLFEKPKHFKGLKMAWGILGFKSHFGENLFDKYSHVYGQLENTGFCYLKTFEDITRK